MNILPPRVLGPLSECSRSALVSNVIPGATVTLIVNRGGIERRVGHKIVAGSKDTITLDAGEELVAGDLVNARQTIAPDDSPRSTDGPSVQISVPQIDAAQVLTQLYQCSRGFMLGGMRPGTTVEILQGGAVIGTGITIDGSLGIYIPNGLPDPSVSLIARQKVCIKPTPVPPGSWFQQDSALPASVKFPYDPGQTLPAPSIVQGLTACSRAVQVAGIQPGSEVVLEATNGAWWASLGASDNPSGWLLMPLKLREGEEVSIRQEVGSHCRVPSERKTYKVGPHQVLGKPGLAQIDCNSTPTLGATGLKPETDVEFSVSVGGVETTYHSVVSEPDGTTLPAPPMPAGAVVKVRQGECDIWSDWSDPQTAKPLTHSPNQPKIPTELFGCQDAVPVQEVFPLNGYLLVMSKKRGELRRVPAASESPVISVAPSLDYLDYIWIEHHVCGYTTRSEARVVKASPDVGAGTITAPLYDGDAEVFLSHAVAGARVELWEETKNQLLQRVRAPFTDSGYADVTFSGFGTLRGGWKVFAKTFHCGAFPQTKPSVPVGVRAPVLASLTPSDVLMGQPGFSLTLKGSSFRSGAKARWNGTDRPTSFVSDHELHATIATADVATAKSVAVHVVNPDGQKSDDRTFTVAAPPPPVVGYDEFLIQNCNANTLPGSSIHRPIHIYYRRTDLGTADPWSPINDSPHDADYDQNGHCPADSSVGARLALDDGATYEVVCVDPLLTGCMTGDPNEVTCRRSPVYSVRGKAGGGVRTERVG